VLVVLASRHDRSAEAIVARWGESAAVLSCEDLSTAGWRFDPERPAEGTAVVAGGVVPVADIVGVLTLRPSVFEAELVHLLPEDRPYVAAEMTALLLAWLTALPCRVVNRPTPTSLVGPSWRREQWVQAAVAVGVPAVSARRVVRVRREASAQPTVGRPDSAAAVVVVGERWFADVAPELGDRAVRLARHAGVDLLDVWFDGPEPDGRFLDASPSVPMEDPDLADAVGELFSDRSVPVAWGARV